MSLTTRTRTRPTRTRIKASAGRSEYGIGLRRRILDIVIVLLLSVVVLPIVAVVAVGILLTDGRPIFFRQSRVGEQGLRFTLYKLRTMRVVASGPEVTATSDVRITRLGGFLRRTAIDELPQLWHVLRGQMTLVGPRPESDALATRYPEPCRPILLARPGLTGPAQLHYREKSAVPPSGWADVETYYLQVLVPLRVAADQEYLHRPTLGRTLHYLVLTALFVTGLADVQRAVE
jgi:lipopolysaccharide/colanic/teichoic acid biosynthesis glycosyltransferase